MKIPLWLIALLFAGYTVWCANYWHQYCKSRCCEETPAVSTSSGEPLFPWNTERPVADDNFSSWKKALLAKGGQGDTLTITAHYRASEPGGEKLALARAEALKAMMMPEMPASRIKINTQQIPDDGLADGTAPKASAAFSWTKMVLKSDQSAIIESDNAVTFLFPVNSAVYARDAAQEDYLLKLIEKHRNSTARFTIVGHADNTGNPQKNIELGMARAKSIALFMTKNGIDSNRLETQSKGASEPVADNNTEDGRQQNRRVVITVNR